MAKHSKGMTLVELIIALSVSSIVLIALLSFFIFIQKHYQQETKRVQNQQAVRLFTQVIEDSIRMSSQSLQVDHDGTCTTLYDLEEKITIATYCPLNQDQYTIDDGVTIDGITDLEIEIKTEEDIEYVVLIVEGNLGMDYEKTIVLRK